MNLQPEQKSYSLDPEPEEKNEENTPETPNSKKQKEPKSKTSLIVALIILIVLALISISVAGYFYYTWQSDKTVAEEAQIEADKIAQEAENVNEAANKELEDANEKIEDISKDTDKDGLTDTEEIALGTDPKKKDTDGDGYSDKDEVDDGFDPLTPADDNSSTSSTDLVQPKDLQYQGAFRLPEGQGSDEEAESWGWGGYAMAFYPEGDPDGSDDGYLGSLYGTGHGQYNYVSEINIPAPINSSSQNLSELTVAETVQEFSDMKGGYFELFTELPRTGITYLPKQGQQSTDKLYFSWGQHMQFPDTEEGDAPTHAWSELDLENPEVKGEWNLDGQMALSTNDYMFDIPEAWATKNTKGRMIASGRGQEGGVASQGPSLFATAPWEDGNPPANNAKLENTALLGYEDATTTDIVYDDSAKTMKGYSHSDNWTGASWLSKGNKSTVAFVGTKAMGKSWYGYSDGTVFPTDGSEYTGEVPAAPHNNRGWWADSFEAQIIFYNPDDLAKVAKGQMEAYEPQPYATLNIDKYLYNIDNQTS